MIVLAAAIALFADTLPASRDSVLTLPPVEVPAAYSTDERLRRDPGFARVYDLAPQRDRPATVSDVLGGTVGVHVRQFGGVGGFSTASIRGSSSSQVAIDLDGVPLNSPQYGVVSLGDFPLAALEAVEVYRGGAPLGLDSPGGGVIHLVGRRADGTWLGAAAGEGSFGTRQTSLEGAWRRGSRSALLVAHYLRSNGDFLYLDDNGTPFNAADDTVHARRNDAVESLSLTGRVEQGIGPVALSLVHDRLVKTSGTPGIGNDPALQSRLRTDRALTNLLARWVGRDHDPYSLLEPRLRLFWMEQRDRFSDPDGELTGVRQEDDDRTRRIGARASAGVEVARGQSLAASAELRKERYLPSIVRPTARTLPRSDRTVSALGVEARSAVAGRVAMLATVRRTVSDDSFPGGPAYPGALPTPAFQRTTTLTSWTAGARVDLVAGLAVKGSHARLARMPTLEEMFGNRAGIYGNPRARPETVDTDDIGVTGAWGWSATAWRPARLETQLSAYRSRATDLLVFIQNSQRTSVALNISAARLTGVEWSVRGAWANGLSADVSWTRQWTRDEGEIVYYRDKELPGHPRDEVASRIGGTFRRWRTFYELHLISSNFLDRYNLNPVPSRSLHDIGLAGSPWWPSVEWSAECRNLTDQRAQDFDGYPLPGRMFYLGMRARFDRKETAP